MTADPVVARQGDHVSNVAQVLADTGWKSLPVVDDRHLLLGMISRSDAIRSLSTDDDVVRRRVERHLAALNLTAWALLVKPPVQAVAEVTRGPLRGTGW